MKWWDEGYTGETMASLGTRRSGASIYNKVGRAICEVVNRDIRELRVWCSAEITPGSHYNVEAIHSGELDFGIVQSDIAYTAYDGKGTFAKRPFGDLRSVAVLYPEIVAVMARSDSGNLRDDLSREHPGHRIESVVPACPASRAALARHDTGDETLTDIAAATT